MRAAEEYNRSSAWPNPDYYWNSVILYLSMEGTSFADLSPRTKTITAYGNAATSTTQAKMGQRSGSFTRSSGDRLVVSGSSAYSDFTYGTSDFTIETWLFLKSMPSSNTVPDYPGGYWIYGQGDQNADYGIDFYVLNSRIVFNVSSYSNNNFYGNHGMTTNQWYHVAAVRSGTTITIYVNGSQVAQQTGNSTAAATPNGNIVAIGSGEPAGATGANFDGYMDQYRVTKAARYSGNFVVPNY